MPYLTADNFRPATLHWYTKDLPVPEGDVSDTELADVIAAMSTAFDTYCNDHFEPEPGPVLPAAEVDTTLLVAAGGGTVVYLPRRVRSLTSVEFRDLITGAYAPIVATSYTLSSSVDAAGVVKVSAWDRLTLTSTGGLYVIGTRWPDGPAVLRLTGKFSWPATPPLVRRAVALMVWNGITPEGDPMRRAQRIVTLDATYETSHTSPTGLPEVDKIIAQFHRRLPTPTSIRVSTDSADRTAWLPVP